MYKTSVAINIQTILKYGKEKYLEQLNDAKIDRLFITTTSFIFNKDNILFDSDEVTKETINFFKDAGLEVGIWLSTLGHGSLLPGTVLTDDEKRFTLLKGLNNKSSHGFCPADKDFKEMCCINIKKLAEYEPDLIQLDDDFRLNYRGGVELACFCDKHLEEFYDRIGERVPFNNIKKLIITGGNNKYRTAYLQMCRETLLDFAKSLREALDEVNPNIRLNSCGTLENWDSAGTDMIEIAKCFAGNTQPFMRTNAGPYWHGGSTHKTIIDTIEFTRMQANWCKGSGIEVFAEGDTYPRPTYNKPANLLELFDLPLYASGEIDGNLKYMFDYFLNPDYETGYLDSHIRNKEIRNDLEQIFKGKKAVGTKIIATMHVAENREYSVDSLDNVYSLRDEYRYLAFLPTNSIPTTFENSDYPSLIVGENAKYISDDDLKNGAIIDIKAAEILNRRGLDTGLLSAKKSIVNDELFIRHDDTVLCVNTDEAYEISVNAASEILSLYTPINTPSTYIYNNFLVIAADMSNSYENMDAYTKNYFFNYYRQEDLIYAIEKLCGKKLPVVSKKHPMLYTLASKSKDSMAVALSNIFEDGIYNGKFELDKEYSEIRLVNCSGKLDGNIVTIDEISPFGFAAFEVK